MAVSDERRWDALPRPIAFVMSGGASLGAIQVGMLKVLDEQGIEPDMIVAASVGALNGAFIADQGMASAVVSLPEVWERIDGSEVMPGGRLTQALRIAAGSSMYPSSGLQFFLENALEARSFEELDVPLSVLTTEVLTGHPRLLDSGDLVAALLATTAIPGVYPWVEIEGELCWDGGMSANVPLQSAVEAGAASLVVLDAISVCHRIEPPDTVPEAVVDAIHAMLRQRVRVEAPVVAEEVPVLYIEQPCVEAHPLDFTGSAELIDEAEEVARRFLEAAEVPEPGHIVGSPDRHEDHA